MSEGNFTDTDLLVVHAVEEQSLRLMEEFNSAWDMKPAEAWALVNEANREIDTTELNQLEQRFNEHLTFPAQIKLNGFDSIKGALINNTSGEHDPLIRTVRQYCIVNLAYPEKMTIAPDLFNWNDVKMQAFEEVKKRKDNGDSTHIQVMIAESKYRQYTEAYSNVYMNFLKIEVNPIYSLDHYPTSIEHVENIIKSEAFRIRNKVELEAKLTDTLLFGISLTLSLGAITIAALQGLNGEHPITIVLPLTVSLISAYLAYQSMQKLDI